MRPIQVASVLMSTKDASSALLGCVLSPSCCLSQLCGRARTTHVHVEFHRLFLAGGQAPLVDIKTAGLMDDRAWHAETECLVLWQVVVFSYVREMSRISTSS